MNIPSPRHDPDSNDDNKPGIDIWSFPEEMNIIVCGEEYPGNLRMIALGFHLITRIKPMAEKMQAAKETAAAAFGQHVSEQLQQRITDPDDPLDYVRLAYDLSAAVLGYRP